MYKLLSISIVLALVGCGGGGGGSSEPTPDKPVVVEPVVKKQYIVAGGTNARSCEWSYFEDKTGSTIIEISENGKGIDQIIDALADAPQNISDSDGIIFIDGEYDGAAETDPDYYVEAVELYQAMLSERSGSDLPLYISTVGYHRYKDRLPYANIREAVNLSATLNPSWTVAYDEAQYFIDWDMLTDNVHFGKEGCELIMDAMADAIQ